MRWGSNRERVCNNKAPKSSNTNLDRPPPCRMEEICEVDEHFWLLHSTVVSFPSGDYTQCFLKQQHSSGVLIHRDQHQMHVSVTWPGSVGMGWMVIWCFEKKFRERALVIHQNNWYIAVVLINGGMEERIRSRKGGRMDVHCSASQWVGWTNPNWTTN